MLLRWLLPIVAVFALLGNAITTFAATGTFGESGCCCPDPKACKCHDHDKPRPDDQIRKCGGEAVKVAPTMQAVVLPEVLETAAIMEAHELEYAVLLPGDQFVAHPETPPF